MKDNIAKIRAALEWGEGQVFVEALAALAELEKAAAEPVATLVGFDVESGRPVDIAWHTDCAAFNSGDKLYTTTPPAKPAPLGPALGLVEIREPSDAECIAINEHVLRAHGIEGCGAVLNGRVIFDVVAKWLKGEL